MVKPDPKEKAAGVCRQLSLVLFFFFEGEEYDFFSSAGVRPGVKELLRFTEFVQSQVGQVGKFYVFNLFQI